jgi:enediyne biosynthesis protein E4
MNHLSGKLLAGLFILLVCAAVFFIVRNPFHRPPAVVPQVTAPVGQEHAAELNQLRAMENREAELNKTVWAREMLAEDCGQVFDSLWDSLNRATNKFDVLKTFDVGKIVMARFNPPRALAHGIQLYEPSGTGRVLSPAEWQGFLDETRRAGWEIQHTEFRHTRFDTDASGQPAKSRYYFRADLINPAAQNRASLEGDLIVDWAARPSGPGLPAIRQIDASGLTLKTRRGEPLFVEVLSQEVKPLEKSHFIDPLILYDLDGDGYSEIILAARNLLLRRQGEGHYNAEPLLKFPRGLIFTGIMADFDGDGHADFLCANAEGLVLFKGSPKGTFDEPGRVVWAANPPLKYGQVLTCGDINHDGSLDIFLAQYKAPYSFGQMPSPYYDANDGFPSYLLLNDGQGNFTDATASAGLAAKRWRRAYSSSFVDLDGDGNLDLLVVSDFAGADSYRNDGHGHFTDTTREWLGESHAFGMSHALADFRAAGRLDLLMIGMNSPTADRLEHLGLWRPGVNEDRAMRSRMVFGNRLYLARANGGFRQSALNDSIARSGWAWGCSAFDFDNDGFPDVCIATGMKTKQSVRDFDPEFWLRDIHIGASKEDAAANLYFQTKFRRTLDESYGGNEQNRFYLNQKGESFIEAGFLLGVGLAKDSRCVVADDLDGDGRVDLLVTTYEYWPELKQTLHVYRNTLADAGNWMGFHFQESGGGVSPVGVKVTLRAQDLNTVREIVTGDSYRSQHANTVHFGLGQREHVDTVKIDWVNGQSVTLRDPRINQYHPIRAPMKSPAAP